MDLMEEGIEKRGKEQGEGEDKEGYVRKEEMVRRSEVD